MAVLKLPFREFSSYTVTVTLDRKSYIFEFNWNSRTSYWTYSIFINSEEKIPVIEGRLLRINVPLLDQYKAYPNIPQGLMLVVRPDGSNQEPGRLDLYSNHAGIIYEEVEEIA